MSLARSGLDFRMPGKEAALRPGGRVPKAMSATARSAKLKSIAQWDAMLARYPVGAPLDLISQGAGVLAANAFVLHLLWTGRMQPFELVLLVALEAVLLTAIARVQMLFVPASALMEKPQPLRAQLGTLLFGTVWLGAVYGIFLGALLGSGPQLLAAAKEPWLTIERSGLVWPLAIALLGAAVDSVRDWMNWRARGGYFLSTPGFYAGARWLTLFLGGIPFFIPLAAVFFGGVTLLKRMGERFSSAAASSRSRPLRSVLPWLGLGAGLLVIFGITRLVRAVEASSLTTAEAWAIGYCSAKLVSEAFVAFLPWMAKWARADEAAKLGEAPSGQPPQSGARFP